MQHLKKVIAICLVAFLTSGSLNAQEEEEVVVTDSLSATIDSLGYVVIPLSQLQQQQQQQQQKGFWGWVKKNFSSKNPSGKNFDYTVVLGPSYTKAASFTLAGGVMGTYSCDKKDSTLQRSFISAMLQGSVKGLASVNVVGRNYLKQDRWRLNYKLKAAYMPIDFWGVGYEAGRHAEEENFNRTRIYFKPEVLYRIGRTRLFVGLEGDVNYVYAHGISDKSRIDNQRTKILAVGMGPTIQFDSRDNTASAHKGVFLRFYQLFYPNFANKYAFSMTDLTFSAYKQLWRGSVLAGEIHGMFNNGDEVPWTMMAQVAEDTGRMRGYYEGRYNDRNLMEAQIELRQNVYKRIGVAIFGGAANVFDYFDNINWKHTLPNYGFGLRYAFKADTGLRLDFGFTNQKMGVVFSINEAF